MKEKILTWLKTGANATEGVQLLTEACAPSRLLRMYKADMVSNRRMAIDWLCRHFGIDRDYTHVAGSQVVVFTEIVSPQPQSFRDEFPFLNDPSCPPELETLASRKFAKYHAYTALHKKLRSCTSVIECAQISRELINNYLENRMIWDELNYYKQHKSVLGKHPIFLAFRRRKEFMAMTLKDLMIRQRRLKDNIWRVKNEIFKGDKPHLEMERKARLFAYETELAEINRLLGDE